MVLEIDRSRLLSVWERGLGLLERMGNWLRQSPIFPTTIRAGKNAVICLCIPYVNEALSSSKWCQTLTNEVDSREERY